jgi:hypothetical protein
MVEPFIPGRPYGPQKSRLQREADGWSRPCVLDFRRIESDLAAGRITHDDCRDQARMKAYEVPAEAAAPSAPATPPPPAPKAKRKRRGSLEVIAAARGTRPPRA